MIHLIWSIINGLMVIYFLYLIIGFIAKGKKIFKPQFKIVSIVILVIGTGQIITASNFEETSNQISITKDYNRNNYSEIKQVKLEDNWTFDINMLVKYSIEENEYIPIESDSFLTGLVSGYVWEFKSIDTKNMNPNGKAEFSATGILKWNLFGITVYSESKTFNGTIQ
ncbi:hypothetical protein [Nonlabens xiamenensis]|uniref:hypothetical protein n=1 Tax=Nonlabens xiamenensis TaxID=2341043 RepID=UPI000F60BDB4|nr:hypothetical protein [Nonlabens xiamenensis]